MNPGKLNTGLALFMILLLMIFKAIDLSAGWTAEQPSYPVTSSAR